MGEPMMELDSDSDGDPSVNVELTSLWISPTWLLDFGSNEDKEGEYRREFIFMSTGANDWRLVEGKETSSISGKLCFF